jgi:hypothetical protein
MKPRALQTIKILAVAVAAAGCTRAVGPEVGAEPAGGTIQPSAPTSPAPVQEQAPLPSDPQPSARPSAPSGEAIVAFFALARELDAVGVQKALLQEGHFRPLCDKDGYPLVGNAGNKGLPRPPSNASKFCAALRTTAGR